MTRFSSWIASNFTCEHIPIDEYWKLKYAEFPVERPKDYHNPEEESRIAENERLMANHEMTLESSKIWSNNRKWIMNLWKQVGPPNLIYWQNGKCGMRDLNGNDILIPIYDEIKLDYHDFDYGIFHMIVRDGDYWGVINREGNIEIPFEYDDIYFMEECLSFVVKKNGKFGVISYNSCNRRYEDYVKCEMNKIFHLDVMGDLVLFEKNGKLGWKGCQFPENDSDAEYDAVYMPTKEYYNSPKYDDDIITFEAVKDGKWYTIEWFTTK